MRQHWKILGEAEIVLQQGSRSRSSGFPQRSEQVEQPLVRLGDSRPIQLANLDEFSTLNGQPPDRAVSKNLKVLAKGLLARIQDAVSVRFH